MNSDDIVPPYKIKQTFIYMIKQATIFHQCIVLVNFLSGCKTANWMKSYNAPSATFSVRIGFVRDRQNRTETKFLSCLAEKRRSLQLCFSVFFFLFFFQLMQIVLVDAPLFGWKERLVPCYQSQIKSNLYSHHFDNRDKK